MISIQREVGQIHWGQNRSASLISAKMFYFHVTAEA